MKIQKQFRVDDELWRLAKVQAARMNWTLEKWMENAMLCFMPTEESAAYHERHNSHRDSAFLRRGE